MFGAASLLSLLVAFVFVRRVAVNAASNGNRTSNRQRSDLEHQHTHTQQQNIWARAFFLRAPNLYIALSLSLAKCHIRVPFAAEIQQRNKINRNNRQCGVFVVVAICYQCVYQLNLLL